MKALQKILIAAAFLVFLNSGRNLLHDYAETARNARDLQNLSQIVERSALAAETAQGAQPEPIVRLVGRSPAAPDLEGSPEDPSGAEKNANDQIPALLKGTEADSVNGLVAAVQDCLRDEGIGAPASMGMIRLVIAPAPVEPDFSDPKENVQQESGPAVLVKALVLGRTGIALPEQAIGEHIGKAVERYIENDASWIVQSEVLDLSVRGEPVAILPQYEALHEDNEDMVGWIAIEGTQINYPVMQTTEDPEFYLRRNFAKEYAYCGLPFVDGRCDLDNPNHSVLVYAHNMKNGTMFGQLQNYQGKRYWEQHREIRFDLLHETRTYEIISVFQSREFKEGEEGFRYHEYIDLSDRESFIEFAELARRESIMDTGVTANWGDQILMLSTCSYHVDAGTLVVVAKRSPER